MRWRWQPWQHVIMTLRIRPQDHAYKTTFAYGAQFSGVGQIQFPAATNENCQLHSFIMPFLPEALSPAYPSFACIYIILHINIVKSEPPVALHKISPPFMSHSVHATSCVCGW